MKRRTVSILALAIPFGTTTNSLASNIPMTSGTSGSIVMNQSFNETRGVDVTVLNPAGFTVRFMTLDTLKISPVVPAAIVRARIYDSNTTAVVASAEAVLQPPTIFAPGPILIPIYAYLPSGGNYRICFFVDAGGGGAVDGFDPAPSGPGGFPYVEGTGQLRINQAYSIGTDSFPTNPNLLVPPGSIGDDLSFAPWSFCYGDGTASPCPCGHTVPSMAGCQNFASLTGASIGSTGIPMISDDKLTLFANGLIPFGPGLYFQGDASIPGGTVFGNGLLCLAGVTARLEIRFANASGASASTVPIHAFGAVTPGSPYYYQLWYRDDPSFCPLAGFNLTNAITVYWAP